MIRFFPIGTSRTLEVEDGNSKDVAVKYKCRLMDIDQKRACIDDPVHMATAKKGTQFHVRFSGKMNAAMGLRRKC
ncbi:MULTISPECIES: flagellar brake domain-containing protein [Halobacillus]|uniref:flagellar brake domain-containing protein n=2 Tax=Halobacillus TaxID=45667 RepID=UPI0013697295